MKKSRFTILHLSDIHIGPRLYANDERAMFWRKSLAEDIKHAAADVGKIDCIVVTGDITFSGARKEFAEAKDFLSLVSVAANAPKEHVLVIPGNHDFSLQDERANAGWANFMAFANGFGVTEKSAFNTLRVFKEHRIAFVLLQAYLPSSQFDRDLLQVEMMLQSPELDNFLVIAAVHYGGKLPSQSKDEYMDGCKRVSSFLDRWQIPLVLNDSGHRAEHWSVIQSSLSPRFHVAASTTLREPWRVFAPHSAATWPSYNLVVIDDDLVHVDRRTLSPISGRWEHLRQGELRFHVQRTAFVAGSRIRATDADENVSDEGRQRLSRELSTLPHDKLTLLLDDLQPALKPFDPVGEAQSTFARRLVDYFSANTALSVLEASVRKVNENMEPAAVFLSYSSRNEAEADAIRRLITEFGHKALRTDALGSNDNAWTQIRDALSRADIFVAILSKESVASPNCVHELGMWAGARGPRRAIGIVVDEVDDDWFPMLSSRINVKRDQLGTPVFVSQFRSEIMRSLST